MINERYANETVSASGLSALADNPRKYRNYKDRVDQTSTSFFDLGSAIHCMVLEPKEFDDRYIVLDVNAPSPMYEKYIRSLLANRQKGEDEWSSMQTENWKINAHADSGFKWSSDKVWEKFQSDKDLKGYYEILVKADGKVVLTKKDQIAIDACLVGIKAHTKASELLYGHLLSDSINEQEVVWKHPTFPDFMMKSIFDRLIINTGTKTATLVDLKTTSKSVYDFNYSYRKYHYYRQMALYKQAVQWFLENKGYDIGEWNIDVFIVATQTNGFGDTAVFTPSTADISTGIDEANVLLDRMKYHFDNDVWDHPREYYENNGVITLTLDDKEV
jgi:hypothetical protein